MAKILASALIIFLVVQACNIFNEAIAPVDSGMTELVDESERRLDAIQEKMDSDE